MNTPQDGGPAFPYWNYAENTTGGMSLRDWFAGMALPKVISEVQYCYRKALYKDVQDGAITWLEAHDNTDADCLSIKREEVAYAAYAYADAMLAARERKEDA